MRANILEASIALLAEGGFSGWSIERVARRAGCAKGLVIHYYGTRPELLAVSGREIGRRRQEDRLSALRWDGTVALDRLWAVLVDHSRNGLTRAAILLAAHGFVTVDDGDGPALHKAVLESLGISADSFADQISLWAMLEGIELQLIRGVGSTRARSSYDRLWASLISA